MITIPAGVRVLVATRPVDFRKGPHGLAALAAEVLGEDPFSGTVLVFRSKRADRIKLLVWDGSGLVLVWKQLPQGSFRWPAAWACLPGADAEPGQSACLPRHGAGNPGATRRQG